MSEATAIAELIKNLAVMADPTYPGQTLVLYKRFAKTLHDELKALQEKTQQRVICIGLPTIKKLAEPGHEPVPVGQDCYLIKADRFPDTIVRDHELVNDLQRFYDQVGTTDVREILSKIMQ